MNTFSMILIVIVALMAGAEGILDEFEFHQPILACSLVGIATGHIAAGVMLGSALQLIALGWMNIGAAVAPDAALASVVSAYLVCGPSHLSTSQGIAIAVPLAISGQFLTILARTITVAMAHIADKHAENGEASKLSFIHVASLAIQGLRIAIPTVIVMMISPQEVTHTLNSLPKVITTGMGLAGGFIVAVGYAMLINMMATTEIWPFFFLGFALAALQDLNLIAMGIIGVCIAFVYLQLSPKFNGGSEGSSGNSMEDELDRELEDL